jgi:hypothetical protein
MLSLPVPCFIKILTIAGVISCNVGGCSIAINLV